MNPIQSFILKSGEVFILDNNKVIIELPDNATALRYFNEYHSNFRKLNQLK